MQNSGNRERHGWIDIAKAFSIILVVLNHELIYFGATEWTRGETAVEAWNGVGDVFLPIRMPLFFLASGLLAASSLRLDRSEAFRKRIANHLYLYILWSVAFALLIPMWPNLGASPDSAAIQIARIVVGQGLAWYLWALPLSFFIGWITRDRPAWIPLSAAFLLAALPLDHFYSGNIFRCLAYFIVGLRMPGLILQASARVDAKLFAAGLGLFCMMLMIDPAARIYIRPLIDLVGVFTAAIGCVLLSRVSRGAVSAGRWVGERTLPIYLLQFPMLSLVEFGTPHILPDVVLKTSFFITLFPLTATIAVVAASLSIHFLLAKAGMGWLFSMPRSAHAKPATENGAGQPPLNQKADILS